MTTDDTDTPRTIAFADALAVWAKIGCLGFGGPAGQIAMMHRELVEKRRWISEPRFLHALNYCMLLPGPEAQQLAVYVGWLMHRTAGGLAAGLLFVLPGALAMLALSALYASYGRTPFAGALLFGLKAAVLAIVADVVLRIGRRALTGRATVGIAVAAFVAIFAFGVPFPLIVAGAAVLGVVIERTSPGTFAPRATAGDTVDTHYVVDAALARGELTHVRPSTRRALVVTAASLVLWFAPVVAVASWLGRDAVVAQQGVFFSQAAMVTFGGAYAVLAYVAQRAVEDFRWLTPGQMLDGLGLAETTPGPLILVVQFVAFQAAYHHQAGLPPLAAGALGAVVTTWVTFAPCFLWIFLGAPYVEALRHVRALSAALSAITAAVVGVIVNLAVWFALHTVFAQTRTWRAGPLAFDVPVASSIDVAAAALALAATVAMLRYKAGMLATLAACVVA
ncbi:MAG TPA: chromate efflux transporter, partial [Tahibacter sp.]|nr:chromate efflux transporter [Tahibacter sp.]